MRWLFVAAWLVFVGCVSRYEIPGADGPTAQPLAQAGTGRSVPVTTTVQIDGSASIAPAGTVSGYHWKVVSRPMASQADLGDADAERTTLTLDAVGRYELELEILDDHGARDTDRVTFTAAPPSVDVNAGSDQQVTWLQTVQLTGSLTVQPGFAATADWSLIQKPTKSTTVLAASATLTPSFYADAEGTYVLQLLGKTPYGQVADVVNVTVTAPRSVLNYLVVAAEYSKSLDKMILATDIPPRLRILNPEAGTESVVVLPAAPTSLSLDPTGTHAAIGHDRALTIVDLSASAVQVSRTVPTYVWRNVYGSGNRVHCLEQGFGFYPITTLDVGTGTVTDGPFVGGYSSGRATPDGTEMYLLDGAGSPESVVHLDLTTTPVTSLRTNLPAHSATSPLVITEDGSTLLYGSGYAYYASLSAVVDFVERGVLGTYMSGAAHSSAIDRIGWYQTEYDQQANPNGTLVLISNATTLDQLRQFELPETIVGGASVPTLGKQIAFRSDGSRMYVLGAAGNTSVLFAVSP